MPKLLRRVVVDTNVLVSYFWGGNPRTIIDSWKQGELILITSPPLLNELERVLDELKINPLTSQELLELIYQRATLVHPKQTVNVVLNDPPDNRVLECALEGKSHLIVSGDKHLLQLKEYHEITILSPKDFVKEHKL